MRSLNREVIMKLLDLIEGISQFLGSNDKTKTLDDLTLDDLRRERIRLEQEEKKLIRQVEELETQKRELFLQGTQESSSRKQVILARKIKELDVQSLNIDKNLQFFSKQLRILNGFIQLKENERILSQSGISKLISGVDLQTLQNYVDRATVDGVFHMDKFEEILSVMEESYEAAGGPGEDEDIMEIVREMQRVSESEEQAPTVIEEGLGHVDQVLRRREKEAEEGDLY